MQWFKAIALMFIFVIVCGSAIASDCTQIRDPQVQLACVLQDLRMQPPEMPKEEASKEAPREDEFYRRELYEYVRPCALRDAARVKTAKGLDYAIDTVNAAFHTEMAENLIPKLRGQPWTTRVISYYTTLHICLMTPRENDDP